MHEGDCKPELNLREINKMNKEKNKNKSKDKKKKKKKHKGSDSEDSDIGVSDVELYEIKRDKRSI